jgi:hypothetical protein
MQTTIAQPVNAIQVSADYQIHLFAYLSAPADSVRFNLTGLKIHGHGGSAQAEALQEAASQRGLTRMSMLEAMGYAELQWGR